MSQPQQMSFELQSVQGTERDGRPRRSLYAKEQLVNTMPSAVRTMFSSFKAGVHKKALGNCLGKRIMSSDSQQTYLWENYTKILDRVINFGSGLRAHEMNKGVVVGILCMSCPEWVIAEQACYGYGFISVPLSRLLKVSSIEQIVAETQMKVLITTSDKLDMLLTDRARFEKLEMIVLIDSMKDSDVERGKAANLTIVRFPDIEEKGRISVAEPTPSHPEEVVTIVYTPGTSGTSKGVELTNLNFLSVMASLECLGDHGAFVKLSKDDVYLAYLPLAHLSERVMMNLALAEGAEIGFFQGDFGKFFDDVAALKPTILSSFPGVLDNLHEEVVAGVEESGPLSLAFFNMAVKGKMKNLRHGKLDHFIYDKLAFKRVHHMFGGRVRALLAGTAPMADDVLDFFRLALGCQIYEMYGLTEITAFGTITTLGDYEQGHVGTPLPCNEVKLIKNDEFGFSPTDLPCPRGEICFRGANVFKQYLKGGETVDSDGWFHSGDLGMFDNRGRLKVIGRKDEIIKLRTGELVVPTTIEAAYRRSKWVAWCYADADTTKSFVLAIIVPEESQLASYAKEHKIAGDTPTEWIKSPKIKEAISKDLNKVAGKCSLSPAYRVRDFQLDVINFSVDNDLLTPEFLLVRPRVRSYYAAQLAELSLQAEGSSSAASSSLSHPPTETSATARPQSKPEESQVQPEPQPPRAQSQPLPLTAKLPTAERVQPAAETASQPAEPSTSPAAGSTGAEETTAPPVISEAEKEIQAKIQARMLNDEDQGDQQAEAKDSKPLTISTLLTEGQQQQQEQQQPQAQSSLSPISG